MGNFFEELKNRNVYKVATAYAVTGWLVIQVVDTVGNNLHWPDAVSSWITRLLIVGFPVALVLTWLYEFTSQGLKRTGTVQQDTPDNQRAGRRLNRIIIASLSVLICFLLTERLFFAGNDSINRSRQASIAILPFRFLSQNQEMAYLADALSAEIGSRLGNLSNLMVAGSTSSAQFKGRAMDAKEIAELLNVNFLMEGEVLYQDNRLRLTTRLINASNGFVTWQENYDREFTHIFEIQEDISRKVAEQLGIEVFMNESDRLALADVENTEAYKVYLKALHVGKSRDSPEEAIRLLNQALELDPDFAKAHAELVIQYSMMPAYSDMRWDMAMEKMEPHMARAEKLAPDQPEVLLAQARFIHLSGNGANVQDSTRILDAVRNAVDMNPNLAEGYHWWSFYLGHYQDSYALPQKEKAVELEPFNDLYVRNLAWALNFRFDQQSRALMLVDKVLKQNPKAKWCARIKAIIIGSAPYGDLAESFKTLYRILDDQDPHSATLSELFNVSLNLGLLPLADRFARYHELRFPNHNSSFEMAFLANAYKGKHRDNLDLVRVWQSNKGLPPRFANLYLGQVHYALRELELARAALEENFPELKGSTAGWDKAFDLDPVQFLEHLNWYILVFWEAGDEQKALSYARKLCELKNSKESPDVRLARSQDLTCALAMKRADSVSIFLERDFFDEKNRFYTNLFKDLYTQKFRILEGETAFQTTLANIEAEIGPMRAEVITYLKSAGDWNPEWDREPGLD